MAKPHDVQMPSQNMKDNWRLCTEGVSEATSPSQPPVCLGANGLGRLHPTRGAHPQCLSTRLRWPAMCGASGSLAALHNSRRRWVVLVLDVDHHLHFHCHHPHIHPYHRHHHCLIIIHHHWSSSIIHHHHKKIEMKKSCLGYSQIMYIRGLIKVIY